MTPARRALLLLLTAGALLGAGCSVPGDLALLPGGAPPVVIAREHTALLHAGVALVFLGGPPPEAAALDQYVAALIAHGYLAPLAVDGYQSATYLGTFSASVQSAAPMVTQERMALILEFAEARGEIPPASSSTWGQTVYLVAPAPSSTVDWLPPQTLDKAPACGYHFDAAGRFPFAVVPRPVGACTALTLDWPAWTELISHELVEAIDTPFAGSAPDRYAGHGEAADACDQSGGAGFGAYSVVRYAVAGVCTFGAYTSAG